MSPAEAERRGAAASAGKTGSRAGDRPDGEDRRRALEALAEELENVKSPLADDARALAWSPSSPSAQRATLLVERVREGTNGRPG